MKEVVFITIGIIIMLAVMGGGGVQTEVSPSMAFEPSLQFQPKIGYMPDNRTVAIDTLNQIDTNIEKQVLIFQDGGQTVNTLPQPTDGLTIIDPAYRECQPLPGEVIFEGPDTKGACFVRDQNGNEFFLNATGSRWPLAPKSQNELDVGALSLEQLTTAYLNAGGELPWSWATRSDELKIEWLKEQLERGVQ